MNRSEQDLDNAQNVFLGHRLNCEKCKTVDVHHAPNLVNLCYQGTIMYKAMEKAAHEILKIEERKNKRDRSRGAKRLIGNLV